MSPVLRSILPFVVLNVVLVVAALILLVTGHTKVAIALMVIDAGNIMFMRYRMFRWRREQRGPS